MKYAKFLSAALIGGTVFASGCSNPAPKASDQAALESQSMTALESLKKKDPTLGALIDKAVGYAIFPKAGKAGFIAGGSYGRGEVYQGGQKIGYADITQATVGLQAGAQEFAELILFLRQQELDNFKNDQFALAGNVSAVIAESGAASTADTSKGVVVFVQATKGAMAEASVGGQRFRYRPLDMSSSRSME
jgi:lipid-binding SYLF domain-containing protein